MIKKFETLKTIHFRDADPAGIMFFANVYDYAHDAYENFIQHTGFEWKFWFKNPDFIIPIRSSHADYFAPLTPGKTYKILVSIKKMGDSSFTSFYEFVKDDKVHCTVELSHTFVNPSEMKKTSIPENIREAFALYLNKED